MSVCVSGAERVRRREHKRMATQRRRRTPTHTEENNELRTKYEE